MALSMHPTNDKDNNDMRHNAINTEIVFFTLLSSFQ